MQNYLEIHADVQADQSFWFGHAIRCNLSMCQIRRSNKDNLGIISHISP